MKKFLKNIVKLKKISTIKRFPVRDISVNFRFGFGLHFLPTTICNVLGYSIIKRRGLHNINWDSINWFNSHTVCACPSSGPGFPIPRVVVFMFIMVCGERWLVVLLMSMKVWSCLCLDTIT